MKTKKAKAANKREANENAQNRKSSAAKESALGATNSASRKALARVHTNKGKDKLIFSWSELPMNPFSSVVPWSNNCFTDNELLDKYTSINFLTFEPQTIPMNWHDKSYASSASRQELNAAAKLVGFMYVDIPDVTEDQLYQLVAPSQNQYDGTMSEGSAWDADGEFSTPEGQIKLSKIYDQLGMTTDGLNAILALQNPGSSPWKIPFIRVATNHEWTASTEGISAQPSKSKKSRKGAPSSSGSKVGSLSVKVYIWFTRLIFELIADDAIKVIIDSLEPLPTVDIKKTVQKPKIAPMFKSDTSNKAYESDTFKFSMPGLMKSAESTGYPLAKDEDIPSDLNVKLYDFQKSTYNWMLDQERSEGGINASFWEEWKYPEKNGGSIFVFPYAGELRLLRPPHTTGGLLCEEMGLGKTVEVISLILGNPRPLNTVYHDANLLQQGFSRRQLHGKEVDACLLQSLHGMWQHIPNLDFLEHSMEVDAKPLLLKDNSSSSTSTSSISKSGALDNEKVSAKEEEGSSRRSSRPKVQADKNNLVSLSSYARSTGAITCSTATLIVTPPVLIHQWWRELQTRIDINGNAEKIDLTVGQATLSDSKKKKGRRKKKHGTVDSDMDIAFGESTEAAGCRDYRFIRLNGVQPKVIYVRIEDVRIAASTGIQSEFGLNFKKDLASVSSKWDITPAVRLDKHFSDPDEARKLETVAQERDACLAPIFALKDTLVDIRIKRPYYDLDIVNSGDDTSSEYTIIRDVRVRALGYGGRYNCSALSKSEHDVGQLRNNNRFASTNEWNESLKLHIPMAEYIKNHLWNCDVVLTNYDTLSRAPELFNKIHWHRIVLDECQEIKVSTGLLATNCAKMYSNHRWMVSGTPLVNSISDLHGELNFLRVWPFSLSETQDGFWSSKIGTPFAKKQEKSLDLMKVLMDSVMMRHSKSQTYIDSNKSLIKMPPRSVEWRSFTLENDYEKCLHSWLESFACEMMEKFEKDARERADNRNVSNAALTRSPHFNKIRSLLNFLGRMLTSVQAVDMHKLNLVLRELGSQFDPMRRHHQAIDPEHQIQVQKMPAEEILAIVQSTGASNVAGGVGAGFNRDTGRVQANVRVAEERLKLEDEYTCKSLEILRQMLTNRDIPIPITWREVHKGYFACLRTDQTRVYLFSGVGINETEADFMNDTTGHALRKNLSKVFEAGMVLRIHKRVKMLSFDFEFEVVSAQDERSFKTDLTSLPIAQDIASFGCDIPEGSRYLGYIELAKPWIDDDMCHASIFKCVEANSKPPYVELLVTYDLKKQGLSGQNNMHDQGFENIYKIMSGQYPECCLCMGPLTRPVVTACVHLFCYECMVPYVNGQTEKLQPATCPHCRAKVTLDKMYEIDESVAVELNIGENGEEISSENGGKAIEEEKISEDVQAAIDDDNSKRKKRVQLDSDEDDSDFDEKDADDSTAEEEADDDVNREREEDQGKGKRKRGQSKASKGKGGDRPKDSAETVFANSSSSSSSPDTLVEPEQSETTFILPRNIPFSSGSIDYDYKHLCKHFSNVPTPQNRAQYPAISPKILGIFLRKDMLAVSSRIRAVSRDMDLVHEEDPVAKFVIFSQYPDSLPHVKTALRLLGKASIILTTGGRNDNLGIAEVVNTFLSDEKVPVLLLATGPSAAGLTLTGARVCYMLEPVHNAAEEAQALNRVHRIGQASSVRCVIFYAKQSFEERVVALRNKANTLTTVLNNVHNITDEEEEKEDEEVVAPFLRKAARKQRGSSVAHATARGGNFTANQIKLLLGCDEKRKLRKEEVAEKEEDEKVTTAQRYNSSSSANWSNSNWGLAPPRRGLNGSGINRGNSAPRSTNSNNNNINHGAVIDLTNAAPAAAPFTYTRLPLHVPQSLRNVAGGNASIQAGQFVDLTNSDTDELLSDDDDDDDDTRFGDY